MGFKHCIFRYVTSLLLVIVITLTGCRGPLDKSSNDPLIHAGPRQPAAPAASPRTSPFGLNTHIASRYPHFGKLSQPAVVANDLQIGWAREDVQWSRVEPQPGKFDWSWHDTVFAAHRQQGINIIGVLGPAVGWATPEPNDPPNGVSFFGPDPDRYAEFAAAVATRYKGVVSAWEIWNEPENGILWQPAPDPVAYARLLKQASAAIKAVDPQVLVLNGGVVPYDPGFLDALATHDAWNAFDVLSIHAYVDPSPPEAAQIDIVGVRQVAQQAAKYGSKPIWITEFGWTTGPCERDPQGLTDEDEQADYLARGATLLRAAGAERVLWYNFKDHPGRPCYGLVRGGESDEAYESLKPAAAALRTLSTQIGNAQPRGAQDLMTHAVVLPFDDAQGWGTPFPPRAEPLTFSSEQTHSGAGSARIGYDFGGQENNYVAFSRQIATPLPDATTRIGAWVYGDGSGHMLHVRLRDAEGEVLQYRLGFLTHSGWEFMSTSITGEVEQGNRITAGNGWLDGTVQIREIVVDDYPNAASGAGTIFVDDLTAFYGPEVYAHRFAPTNSHVDEVVDVIWALDSTTITLATASTTVAVTTRDGAQQMIPPRDGQVIVSVGPAPIYLRHIPPP